MAPSTLSDSGEALLEPVAAADISPAGRLALGRSRLMKNDRLLGIFDQAIVSGTSFVMGLIVARTAGVAQFGVLTLTLSIIVLLTAAVDAFVAIPFTLAQAGKSGARLREYSGNALLILAACTFILLGGWFGLSLIGVSYPEELLTTGPLLLAVLPGVFARQFFRRYYLALGRIRQAVCFDGVVCGFQLAALAAAALLDQLSAATALLILGGATLFVTLAFGIANGNEFLPSQASLRQDVRYHLKTGRWLFGSEALSVVCGYSTIWILAFYSSEANVGAFAAAAAIIYLANPFLFGVANVLEGKAAAAYAGEGITGLRLVIASARRCYLVIMIPLALIVSLCGAQLVNLLYGDTGLAGLPLVIVMLALAATITSVGMTASCGLRAMGRADLALWACVIDLLAIVALSFWLVPQFGVLASAAAVLAGSLAGTTFRCLVLRRFMLRDSLCKG